MNLIVGLGNFGKEYDKTRHNCGFLLIDKIIARFNFTDHGKKYKSEFFSGEIAGSKIIALKPQTYMNNSGLAVMEALNFYKIPLQNLIVCHDDLDLAFGKIKYKIGGGNSGHNGLKSIDNQCGNGYARLRIGIGRPENLNYQIADYVLSKFSEDDLMFFNKLTEKICDNFQDLINNDSANFLNKIALKS